MTPTGFKVVVERQDGQITTWRDVFNRKVEKIMLDVLEQKGWGNGTVKEAYLEFDNDGEYYKVYLDCARLNKILSLMGKGSHNLSPA